MERIFNPSQSYSKTSHQQGPLTGKEEGTCHHLSTITTALKFKEGFSFIIVYNREKSREESIHYSFKMDSVRSIRRASTSSSVGTGRNSVVGRRASTASPSTITSRTRSSIQPKRSTRQAASNNSTSLIKSSNHTTKISATRNGHNGGAARGEKLDDSKLVSSNHNTRARNGIRKEMKRVSCFIRLCGIQIDFNHFFLHGQGAAPSMCLE